MSAVCPQARGGVFTARRRARRRPAVVAGLLGLMLGGCGGGEEDSASGGGFLPPAGYVADAARGRALFQANCARCHGAGARGTGQGPPLLHPVYRPGHHADLAFYLAVRNGVQPHHWKFGPMPPVRGLDPEAVADIVAWVRQQQRAAGIQ